MQWLFLFKPPGTSWDYTIFFTREFGASFRLSLFKLGTYLFHFFVCVLSCSSHVPCFEIPWIIAHQAPLSMEFFRKNCCSGFLYSAPGDLPNHGIEPTALASLALAGRFLPLSSNELKTYLCVIEIEP